MTSTKKTEVTPINRLDFVLDATGMTPEISSALQEMLAEHRSLRVVIQPVRPTRSTGQNALLMLYARRLAKQAGLTPEGMKEAIKRYAIDMGYPVMKDEEGIPVIDEEGCLVPLPSHMADSAQFALLIEASEQIAYENGYRLEND